MVLSGPPRTSIENNLLLEVQKNMRHVPKPLELEQATRTEATRARAATLYAVVQIANDRYDNNSLQVVGEGRNRKKQ